jgi:phosphopantetheinyl transferase
MRRPVDGTPWVRPADRQVDATQWVRPADCPVDATHVWVRPVACPEGQLTASERAELAAVGHAGRAAEIRRSRPWARAVLAGYLGIDPLAVRFRRGRWGKPHLVGHQLQFNLAHTGEHVVLAVSDRPVGIDVEPESRDLRRVVRRCSSPDEQARLTACSPAEVVTAWTLKEAYAKALGLGHRLTFAKVETVPDIERADRLQRPRAESGAGLAECWSGFQHPVHGEGCVGADESPGIHVGPGAGLPSVAKAPGRQALPTHLQSVGRWLVPGDRERAIELRSDVPGHLVAVARANASPVTWVMA